MAKVRVYELAKDLSMENKSLIEKLVAGGMDIRNHMSTLDEEQVIKAKEIVSGAVSEVIEEKRIKPTVIRRRKKVKIKHEIPKAKEIESKPEDEKTVEPPVKPKEVAAEEAEVQKGAKKETKKKIKKEEQIKETSDEETLQDVDKEERKQKPVPKEALKAEAKSKKAKKKKIDKPAKIVKLPEEGPLRDILAKKAKKKLESKPAAPKRKPRIDKPGASTLLPTDIKEEIEAKKLSKKKGRKLKVEKKEPKQKGSFRRQKKAIYERSDLYADRGLRPKRKGGGKKSKAAVKKGKKTKLTTPKALKRRIKVQEFVTIAELAKTMGVKAIELIKKLMDQGVAANINQPIDFETAALVADEFGYELELDTFEEKFYIRETEDKTEDLEPRPPVVTIMGHVDHGKTSLLDQIRKSNIIGGESGGITQHIGAYYVNAEGGDIVFLDTPGHEAFTAMRARGAKITDIIILVVAADDGVMPQTKEAINHARAADIPIVLAINKIDKPDANPEKVKRELSELGVATEDWGGDIISGHISAKTGEGIDDLLNLILLQSEVLELKANPDKMARGTVIEAKLDKLKGSVATVLIGNGTLRTGDLFVCGEFYGRVRAMHDQRGKKMDKAGPAVPVEIHGISGVPMAGDEFIVVKDEKRAKQIVEHRKAVSRKQDPAKKGIVSLEDLFEKIKEGEIKELNIVLKTDVQGSLEALAESLIKQSTEEVKLKIIHSATGAVTESDVMLAFASNAIIIGFNVRANPRVSEVAEKEKVDIRYYDVIYNAIKDIRLAMTGLLDPVYEENTIGRADIKEIFRVPKLGAVAGCYITDGHVERNANIRLLRDDVVVFDGKIASLRRFKEDVKVVQTGYECGIGLENYNDIKPGDSFEVYLITEVEAEL
ncbi:MAG: translation initiation factor IF-2 [Desulfobacterales bacterium]|nr:translation initiation factor IF-2 [Desulfobacterales bacterium]